jgi:hypothetical protein
MLALSQPTAMIIHSVWPLSITPDVLDAKRVALKHHFGLTVGQSAILALLYEAKGDWVQTHHLSGSERVNANAVMIRIVNLKKAMMTAVCRLRQALDCEAIDSKPGCGYRLTEIGMDECKAAITWFRENLV